MYITSMGYSPQYADALLEWSAALKAVDPTVSLGANGPSNRWGVSEVDAPDQTWWKIVMGRASHVVDFVICHSYPVYGWDYTTYSRSTQNLQVCF